MNKLTANHKRCLEEFAWAAVRGLRAPTLNDLSGRGLGYVGKITRELAFMGFITIEVYGQNWRVITINRGAHAGKRTLPRPAGGSPYLRLDKDGRHDLSMMGNLSNE